MSMLPPDPVYIFKGEMLSVSCVAFKFTELTQRLYGGTQAGNVHVWNLMSKREIGIFKAGDDTCLSICIPSEENLVITHVKSGIVSFWQEKNDQWELKKLIKTDFFGFCKCQVFDNIFYSPIKDSKCELISVETMEPLKTVNLETDKSGDIMAFKVCSIKKKKVMIVAYEGLILGLWDIHDLKNLSCLRLTECPMAVDYDGDTNKGLCADASDKLLIFSLDNSLNFEIKKFIAIKNAGVAAVKIRPDGKLVAIGCWDGKLRLYSWKSLVLLAVLDTHSATVQDVSFGAHCKSGSKMKYILAAGSQDSRISLWDIYN